MCREVKLIKEEVMRIKPTMSHVANKEHLNELLVKYYQDLVSAYDQNFGSVHLFLINEQYDKAKKECEIFLDELDT